MGQLALEVYSGTPILNWRLTTPVSFGIQHYQKAIIVDLQCVSGLL